MDKDSQCSTSGTHKIDSISSSKNGYGHASAGPLVWSNPEHQAFNRKPLYSQLREVIKNE